MASDVFQVDVTFDEIDVSKLADMDNVLSIIARQTVSHIKRNMRAGLSYDNTKHKRLAAKTIRDKRSSKGKTPSSTPTTPLMRTGLMYRSIKYWKTGPNSFELGVLSYGSPRRDALGYIHQYEGVNRYTRLIRAFIGMTQKERNVAQRIIKSQVNSIITKAVQRKKRRKLL